jgi:hypothetical protein
MREPISDLQSIGGAGYPTAVPHIQVLFYEDVERIKFGDLVGVHVVRKELRGDFRSNPFFYFWNAWLDKK